MAKVNTNKARKLAGVRLDLPIEDGNLRMQGRYRYVLRTDGTVLRSYQNAIHYEGQSPYWGSANYKIIGRVKDAANINADWLLSFASKRHPEAIAIVTD